MSRRGALGVAWYRSRATFRRRVGGLAALAVLIGLVGGVALASVAAARRTQSSYPRFLAGTNPSDLNISVFSTGAGDSVASLQRKLEALPGVRRVSDIYIVPYAALGADGEPSASGAYVFALASTRGEFSRQDRAAVVHGRRADPTRPDEVDVTPSAARLLRVHAGSTLQLGLHSDTKVIERVRVRVVGVVDLNNQVVEDDVDAAVGFVVMTPAALHDAIKAVGGGSPTTYALQLDHGSRDVAAVEQRALAIVPKGSQYEFHVAAPVVTQDEAAIRPESIALAAFGCIAALVALVVAGQAISRQLRAGDEDGDVLRALGAGPAITVLDGLLGVAAAIVVGSFLAAGAALALSPLAPLGPVRAVYPGRGVAADWTVLAVGVLGFTVALFLLAFLIARRHAPDRRVRAGRRRARVRRAISATRAGVPVPAAVGLQFSLQRDDAPGGAPIRAALLGTVVAVAVVVATLTFAASLQTLVSHPRLYGWNWNYALNPSNSVPAHALDLLRQDHDVAGAAGVTNVIAAIDGNETPIMLAHPNATVAPPTLSGHGLQADNEIVVGATTLSRLHKHVGDTIGFSYGTPADPSSYIPRVRLKVVGTATLPAVGFTSIVADHTSMGTGAIVSYGVEPPAFRRSIEQGDPNENGFDMVFVRMRPGVSAARGRASLRPVIAAVDKALAADPNTTDQDVTLLGVQRPAQIVNYRTVGAAPVVLAAGLALGAIAALALTLGASVRRRRRELALLKTLGFTRRQLSATVSTQASVVAGFGIVVGVPAGVLLGRWLWTLFAREIAAVPSPTVPAAAIAVVAVATIVLANLVGAVPGRRAARVPSALLLHGE